MKRWIVVAVVIFGACGGGSYPDSFKTAFMSNCERTSGGKTSYCACALDYLEDHVAYEDAQNGTGMMDAAAACSP